MSYISVSCEQVKALIPKDVALYYVDYRDNLDEHKDLLFDYAIGGYELMDKVVEWFDGDNRDYYIEGLREDVAWEYFDGDMEKAAKIIVEYIDNISEELMNRDGSDVVWELVRNTNRGKMAMYLSLGLVSNPWLGHVCGDYEVLRVVKHLVNLEMLKLDSKDKARVSEIVNRETELTEADEVWVEEFRERNEWYTGLAMMVKNGHEGDLLIYFDVKAERLRKAFVRDKAKNITVEGTLVLRSSLSGSGWYDEYTQWSVTMPLDKKLLGSESLDIYGFFTNTCGDSDLGRGEVVSIF